MLIFLAKYNLCDLVTDVLNDKAIKDFPIKILKIKKSIHYNFTILPQQKVLNIDWHIQSVYGTKCMHMQ